MMLTGHGKMDDGERKFISSAFNTSTPPPSSAYKRHLPSSESPKTFKNFRQRESRSDSFRMPKSEMLSPTVQYKWDGDDIVEEGNYLESGDKETRFESQNELDFYTANTPASHLIHEERIQGLHHRSRIKIGNNKRTQRGQAGKRRHSSRDSSSSSFSAKSSSPSSPSRFLLTFLSSCNLVQVTSRLVVALAMTSLFLILVHVMPGAYCSSSTSSGAGAVRTTSSTGAATKSYFNQSLQGHHHLKLFDSFQPLSSSTSSFPAGGGYQQQPWLKTRWPVTLKNSNNRGGNGDHLGEGDRGGGGLGVNLNNKLYSNQLGVRSLLKANDDYLTDNQREHQQQNNINTIGSPTVVDVDTREMKSAKLDNNKIATNNYDYYNNGNNNDNYNSVTINNRSNYNYYDSFVEVSQPSQSNRSILFNKSVENNKPSEKGELRAENTQQRQQPMNPVGYEQISNTQDEDDFMDTEIIEATGAGMTQLVGEQQSKASTVKDGITSANNAGGHRNNGTTRAERDTIVNVSSTGVRPTMAFTNSYFARTSHQIGKDERRGGQEVEFGGEDLYGGNQEYNGDIIRSGPSERSPGFPVEDNKKRGEEEQPTSYYYQRRSKVWSDNDGRTGTIPFSPSSASSSSHLFHSNKHHISSKPTAITRTTSTISEGASKHFKSATAAGGSDRISPSVQSSFFSQPTAAQLKSIKFSASQGTLHYPNENGSNVLAVVSSSTQTLSKQHHHSHNGGHSSSLQHHHHHHEQGKEFRGNEVLSFNSPDEYADEVLVDEEEIDGDGDVLQQEITHKQHITKKKSLESNFIDNSPPPPSPSKSNYFNKQQHSKSSNSRKHFAHDDGELIKKGLEPTMSVVSSTLKNNLKKHSHEEEKMVGDDPSALSPGTSSQPKLSSDSTTGGKYKQRSPLQIRRDLTRLIAQAGSSRSLTGEVSGGSIIGADEEPIPNKCDRLFMSSGKEGQPNGTFESPTMISEEGHLYQCIFMFIAKPMERVEVVFTQFNVRGTPPECVHEWVDIWTEVEGTDPTDLVTTPFSGRYCGRIPPRRRISLYGGIAIGFYSDKNSTDETIFRGTFSFKNDSPYQIGTPVPRTLCSYTILGASKRNGDLISPTYPGVYPKNLSCSYKFIGIEGQRIRLEFRDFDVFYGGAHCPFDEVKVYDGMDPTAPLIGTYCGQQRNLVVFSSGHLMLVTFTTLERSTEAQNRGFKGVWEFSESFVKLDFIEKNMGTHIRGTECDQRILSKGQSAGVVYSPNYPFPYVPKIVCRYFVYGLQDPQNLERVRLSFEKFDVITSVSSEEQDTTMSTNHSDVKRCGDGFLKVYLKGQEVIQAYDKADFEFCGKEVPHDVVSDGPRLVLVFSSGEPVGSGFKARYQFETEYRVPGTAAPDGSCHFTYYSGSRMKGEFNSPRFPSNYPSTTNCTYIFFQQPNEQVRIVFDNFKMRSDKFNYTDRGAYGDLCEEDWVEIWNVISDADDRLVGRYCGSTAPGPIESREKASALKVILHTDEEGVSSGFKARYIYFTAKTIFGECGQNITQAQSGVLTSPKWPQKYDGPSKGEGSATCNWYLSVRPGSRVLLHFQNFAIEGEPYGRGCPAAAVRIWVDPDGVPVELCGETLMVEHSQYVSARNLMRVTFITADKAVGAPGFRAVWTEVQEVPRLSSGSQCHHSYFRCEKSQYCIPTELRCDGVENCGTNDGDNDLSDELLCGLEFGDMNTIIAIVVGVAISLFVIVLLCAWGQRRKRRRRRRLQLRRPPIHVCALNKMTSLVDIPIPPPPGVEDDLPDESPLDEDDHLPPPPPMDADDESPLDEDD